MKATLFAAALVLAALSVSGEAVNGGFGCKTFYPPDVTHLMQQAGKNTTEIFAALTSTKSVNYELCKRCSSRSMQIKNVGVVKAGYGECWCKPGFGYSKWTQNGQIRQRYGCSACYKATPNSNPTMGPYNDTAKTWTNTKCTA